MTGLGNRLPSSQKGRLTCKKKNRCEEQLKNGTLRPRTKIYFSALLVADLVQDFSALLVADLVQDLGQDQVAGLVLDLGLPTVNDWIHPLTIRGFPDMDTIAVTGVPASILPVLLALNLAFPATVGFIVRNTFQAGAGWTCRRPTRAEYDAPLAIPRTGATGMTKLHAPPEPTKQKEIEMIAITNGTAHTTQLAGVIHESKQRQDDEIPV